MTTSASGPPAAAGLPQGRAAFNRGEFFLAHELWEDVWRGLDGADRTFVQGLIQIAAGCHHLQKHRPAPAARLIAKGLHRLGGRPPALLVGMDLPAFVAGTTNLLSRLTTRDAPTPDATTLKL